MKARLNFGFKYQIRLSYKHMLIIYLKYNEKKHLIIVFFHIYLIHF
jgi:hypothetical protein